MKAKLIIALSLLVLVLLFAVQNAIPTDVRLLFWQLTFPLYLLILFILIMGIIIGWFLRVALGTHRGRTGRPDSPTPHRSR